MKTDILGKVLDITIAACVMFLIPLLYFGQKQDAFIQSDLYETTTNMIENVSTRGYLTKDMYDGYIKKLDTYGTVFSIDLEQKVKVLEPEYRFKTPDEIIDEGNSAWNGENNYNYIPVYTEKPIVTDTTNNDGLTMNTETNESILAKANNKSADPNHVHTNECYGGSHYTEDNSNPCTGLLTWAGGWGVPLVTNVQSEWSPYVYTYPYKCSKCSKGIVHIFMSRTYYEYTFKYQWTVEVDSLPTNMIQMPIWNDMRTITEQIISTKMVEKTFDPMGGYDNGYNFDISEAASYISNSLMAKGYSPVPVSQSSYKSHSVLYWYWWTGVGQSPTLVYLDRTLTQTPEENNVLIYRETPHIKLKASPPVCNEIIKSIVPTNPVQVIYKGEALITTATATYLDGSTRVVVCNTTFNTNNLGTNLNAILSHTGKDTATTTKTLTNNITVTVLPKSKICINGHTYNLKGDGTDPGCPYCREWLSSLTVYIPSSKELVIYKGTTLKVNGVVLLATYLNGRKEYLTENYVNNLDKNYVGVQTVTVSYKGMYDTLKVTIKRNVKQCNVCSRYYELHPDNSDPGCPYCASLIPVFTGNVMEYYHIKTTDEILTELYEGSGKYYFTQGDYLKIDVKNRTSTNAMNMLKTLYSSEPYKIALTYGSKIRDTGN